MTIAFVGGEITSFYPSNSITKEVTTQYDSAWTRCSMFAQGAGSTPAQNFTSKAFTPVSPAWVHLDLATYGGDHPLWNDRVTLYDAGGSARVILQTVGGLYRLMFDGVQVGVTYDAGTTDRQVIDIGITTNTLSGRIKLYSSGTLQIDSGVIDTSGLASIGKICISGDNLRPNPGYNYAGVYASQVVVADVPTIGYKVATYVPTGNGANTAWTGTYTDIDETVFDDGDFISTPNAGDVETYTLTGPSLGTSSIRAVVVSARAHKGVTGPQNLQLAVRSGGTNYFSSTHALDDGFTPEVAIWETNPATGVAWLAAAIATLEAGAKAIA